MLAFFKSLLPAPAAPPKRERAPAWVAVKGGFELPLEQHVLRHEGFPAAREHPSLNLGEVVAALLERDTPKSWSPNPSKWEKP